MQLQCPRPWMRSDVTGVRSQDTRARPRVTRAKLRSVALRRSHRKDVRCSLRYFIAQDRICSEISQACGQDVCGDGILSPVGGRGDPWAPDPEHQQEDTLRAVHHAQAELGPREPGQGRQEEVPEAEKTLDEQ